ncbi:MAG: fluoride efflux transporter FluC [Alkalilacustris sp.]
MSGAILDTIGLLGLVAAGGALGSILRFAVSTAMTRWLGPRFPWGTLTVNVAGSAAIGAMAALLLVPEAGEIRHLPAWSALVVGVLGSLTTVSSFALQTLALVQDGRVGRAVLNVALSVMLCFGAAAGGWHLTIGALGIGALQ